MAMRIYNEEQFFDSLKKFGLSPTETVTAHHRIWKDDKGDCIAIPFGQDMYPDHILDTILQHYNKLYQPICDDQKQYKVEIADHATDSKCGVVPIARVSLVKDKGALAVE